MKILFYCGGFSPVGGIETFCKNLLSYFQSKNYDSRLICWGKESILLQSIKQGKMRITRSAWRWGCRWNLPDWLLLPMGIQEVQQVDCVIFHKLFPMLILKRLRSAANNNIKFIYITPYRPLVPNNIAERNDFLEVLNLFDLILVQASIFKDDLRQIDFHGRIEVIPLISNKLISRIKPLPPIEEFKIGFLGRLVEDKNLSFLLESFYYFQGIYLESFSLINQRKKPPSLHLFGNGSLRSFLTKLAKKLGIESSVFFYGNIPNMQIEEAITSCHLFAFTSHIEGQCLAALEILSCGRPIVATNVGALPDILSDTRLGKIASSTAPDKFAESLLEIANLIINKQLLPENIQSAYLERYDPEKVGDHYIDLLTSLKE